MGKESGRYISQEVNLETRAEEFSNLSLIGRIDFIVVEDPERFSSETISRVSEFVIFEVENPAKHKRWRMFEDIHDFVLYYHVHPEWHGLSGFQLGRQTKSGGQTFYAALLSFTKKEATSGGERKELLEKVIPSQRYDWSQFTTLEQWHEKYVNHPEWHEMTAGVISEEYGKESGSFYQAFLRWLKANIEDPDERRKRVEELFGYKGLDRQSMKTIYDWRNEFDGHQEWEGRTAEEMRQDVESGANAYMSAFRNWIRQQTEDKEKAYELLHEIFPVVRREWSHLEIIDDWIVEFERHPRWKGKMPREMAQSDDAEARSFYHSFISWTGDNTADAIEAQKIRALLFPSVMRRTRKGAERRKPAGYWTKERIEREIVDFYESYGNVTQKLLIKHGRSDLLNGVRFHYSGGWFSLRVNLELPILKRPSGYWTKERIEEAATDLYQSFGSLSKSTFFEAKRGFLLAAIYQKYPGSIIELRRKIIKSEGPVTELDAEEAFRRLFGEE